MASDLSNTCAEVTEVLDEKEEGEISLEDVSSSEEGHVSYPYGARKPQASGCSSCSSIQHCAPWCTNITKHHARVQNRRDAVQGKENRHHIDETGYASTKYSVTTLQEKNYDLVPISSDSDMEIIGLSDASKDAFSSSRRSRIREKKKKRKSRSPGLVANDLVSSSLSSSLAKAKDVSKQDKSAIKSTHSSRAYHKEGSPNYRHGRPRSMKETSLKRYRIPPGRERSPVSRSRSSLLRARSPSVRKPPRSTRPPRHSPYRSPLLTMRRKYQRFRASQPSCTLEDSHGNLSQLLKKVRDFKETVASQSIESDIKRNKEHASSLKEKLSNMLKNRSDNNGNITNVSTEKSSILQKSDNDADEEEDLALLRQKALETKHNKSSKCHEQAQPETEKKSSSYIDDEQDVEDLKLRMIALRSAVLKKHHERVQRRIKSGKSKKTVNICSESPFTDSFLDSIPILSEDNISPPQTPPSLDENNHAEDMELDTDVEREKETLPYSPTDKITTTMPTDTELLGLQASDVSFVSASKTNKGYIFPTKHSKLEQDVLQGNICDESNYLPNPLCYANANNSECRVDNADAPYFPSESIETNIPNEQKSIFCLPLSRLLEASIRGCEGADVYDNEKIFAGDNTKTDVPYYSGATTAYISNLPQYLPFVDSSVCQVIPLVNNLGVNRPFNEEDNKSLPRNKLPTELEETVCKPHTTSTNSQTNISENDVNLDSVSEDTDNMSLNPMVGSAVSSPPRSLSPNSSMMTIEDIMETDTDVSSSPLAPTNPQSTSEYGSSAMENAKEEPLYMRGVPDVTKDHNKIPTLVHRRLVPSRILNSNKHLQQQLMPKRPEVLPQPTFKSAEMQAVTLDSQANVKGILPFKPMTLVQPLKKPPSSVPVGFNDDSLQSVSQNDNFIVPDNSSCIQTSNQGVVEEREGEPTLIELSVGSKRRKRTKKRSTPRNRQQLSENKNNVPLTTNDINNHTKTNIDRTSLCHQTTVSESRKLPISTGPKKNDENHISKSLEDISERTFVEDGSRLECAPSVSNKEQTSTDNEQEKPKTVVDDSIEGDAKDETKGIDDRRQSVDEDEEELRAILLASLAKRSKPTDTVTSNVLSVSAPPPVSDTNTTTSIQKGLMQIVTTTSDTSSLSSMSTTRAASDQTKLKVVSKDDKICLNSAIVPNIEVTKEIYPNVTVEVPVTEQLDAFVKKRVVTANKNPMKKVFWKVSVPASTKVVNNAKKYQNTMVQRKLNLQKAASLYNAQRQTKSLSTEKLNEYKWPANTKVTRTSDTQRFVINLDSDTDSESDSEQRANRSLISCEKNAEVRPAVIPAVDFEKSIDQFLRDVRKKQESVAAKPVLPISTPVKNVSSVPALDNKQETALHTPSAVRHLPASRQEEYHRLKQQIIEREKLKLKRRAEGSGSNNQANNKTPDLPSSVPTLNPIKESVIPVQSQSASVKIQSSNRVNAKPVAGRIGIKENDLKTVSTSSTKKLGENTSGPIANNPARLQMTGTATGLSNVKKGVDSNLLKEKDALNKKLLTNTVKSPSLTNLTEVQVKNKFMEEQQNRQASNQPCINKITTLNKNKIEEDKISKKVTSVKSSNSQITQIINENKNSSSKSDSIENNEIIDSDASTIILPENQVDRTSMEISQSDESTLIASQYLATQSNESSTNDKSTCQIACKNLDNSKNNSQEFWNTMRKDSAKELSALISLSQEEQKKCLVETEHKLVTKRYSVLDDLAEMLGNLRQWDMERDLQTSLVMEVKKLREQLRVAEERLMEQNNRINNMTPKVVLVNEKINDGRRECYKLVQICSGLGTRIVGQDYKVPEAGAHLLENRVKEVAMHTRQLSRKRVSCTDLSEINAPITPLHNLLSTIQTENTQEPFHVDTTPPLDQTEETSTYVQTNTDQNSSKSTNDTCILPPDVTSTPYNEVNDHETVTHNAKRVKINNNSNSNIDSEQTSTFERNDSIVELCSNLTNVLNARAQHSMQKSDLQTSSLVVVSDKESQCTKQNIVPLSNNAVTTCNVESPNLEQNCENQLSISDKIQDVEIISSKQDHQQSDTLSAVESQSSSEKSDSQSGSSQVMRDRDIPSPEQVSDLQTCSTNTNGTSEPEESKDITYPLCSVNTRLVFNCQPSKHDSEHQPRKTFTPYISILTHFKAPRNTNLNGILCPFELMGTCSDGDCQFVHLATSHDR